MIIKNDLPFEKADYEEKFLHIQQCYSDLAITFNGHRILYDWLFD